MVMSSVVSVAGVNVLNADDVVLAEVSAGLHLDEVERNFPRFFQPVHAAERNEDRFVFSQQDFLIVARYDGRAVNDDPMLRTMIVFLLRKLGARIDGDAFLLK